MHKILMAERSDLYHDARVQKEASSLRTAGYDVTVIGLRAKRVSIDKEFSFNMDTQYVLDRNWKQIRKLHLAILVLYLNIKILFIMPTTLIFCLVCSWQSCYTKGNWFTIATRCNGNSIKQQCFLNGSLLVRLIRSLMSQMEGPGLKPIVLDCH